MNKEKVLILFSGGADSTLLKKIAEKLDYYIYFLVFDYGQIHKEEIEFAKNNWTNGFDTNRCFRIMDINNIFIDVKSALTSGDKNLYKNVSEWYVPGRNSIFLSIAYSYAETHNIDRIWIGCNFDDRMNLFPDCTQEYIIAANNFFKFAGSKQVKIEAPLLGFTKEMVLKILEKQYNVNLKKIYSGYGDIS